MNYDTIQEYTDPMIAALLKIKRGELNQAEAIDCLEKLKDAADSLIRAVEYDVKEELVHGG